jgi:hypothetical protein
VKSFVIGIETAAKEKGWTGEVVGLKMHFSFN